MTHTSPITCLDTFRTATVSGGYDGAVVLWSGDPVRSAVWTQRFTDLVNDVRFSSDGTHVAVAAADGFAYVLEVDHGEIINRLGPHGDDVNLVRWARGDSMIITAADHEDTSIRVWDVAKEAVIARLDGHSSGVFAVAVNSEGDLAVSVAEDQTARIWNLSDGRTLRVLDHTSDPETVDWMPHTNLILTGADDGVARLWDATSGEVVRTICDSSAAVRFVRFSHDGRRVLVGAYDAVLRIYDTADWTVLEEIRAPFQWERSAAFGPSGIVIGSFGSQPRWHPEEAVGSAAPTSGLNSVAATSDGKLVTASDDGTVRMEPFADLVSQTDTIVNCVGCAHGRKALAWGDYRGNIGVCSLVSGTEHRVASTGGPINSIFWLPSDDGIVSAGYDGKIRHWRVTFDRERPKLDLVLEIAAHDSPIKSIAYSTSHNLVVAGSSDGTISAWRLSECVWRASDSGMVLVNSVAVASGIGHIVSASRDLHLRLWDVESGAPLSTLPRLHTKSIKSVAISHDASRIVSGSYDCNVIHWRHEGDGWHGRLVDSHAKPGVSAVTMLGDLRSVSVGWDTQVRGQTFH